ARFRAGPVIATTGEAMENPSPRRLRRHHHVAILLIVAVATAYALWARGDRSAPPVPNPPPPAAPVPSPAAATAATPAAPSPSLAGTAPSPTEPSSAAVSNDAYEVEHERVKEARGSERVGLAARVSVPPELQHYSDRRRFLAVQMADSHEEQ